MRVIDLLLYLIAAGSFAFAAFKPEPMVYRLRVVAAGLLAWVLVPLIALIQSVAGS